MLEPLDLERGVLDLLLFVLDVAVKVAEFEVERRECRLLGLEFGVGGVEAGLKPPREALVNV